jgi:hypothetical protein
VLLSIVGNTGLESECSAATIIFLGGIYEIAPTRPPANSDKPINPRKIANASNSDKNTVLD